MLINLGNKIPAAPLLCNPVRSRHGSSPPLRYAPCPSNARHYCRCIPVDTNAVKSTPIHRCLYIPISASPRYASAHLCSPRRFSLPDLFKSVPIVCVPMLPLRSDLLSSPPIRYKPHTPAFLFRCSRCHSTPVLCGPFQPVLSPIFLCASFRTLPFHVGPYLPLLPIHALLLRFTCEPL